MFFLNQLCRLREIMNEFMNVEKGIPIKNNLADICVANSTRQI